MVKADGAARTSKAMTVDPAWAWIQHIRKGDVLASGSTLRVVRSVHHTERHTYVFFTIKRCSWTRRCYTVLTQHDLKDRGFRATGKRVRLRSKMDREIEAEINEHRQSSDVVLRCCDVEGIG
jgi:hypothetical protein